MQTKAGDGPHVSKSKGQSVPKSVPPGNLTSCGFSCGCMIFCIAEAPQGLSWSISSSSSSKNHYSVVCVKLWASLYVVTGIITIAPCHPKKHQSAPDFKYLNTHRRSQRCLLFVWRFLTNLLTGVEEASHGRLEIAGLGMVEMWHCQNAGAVAAYSYYLLVPKCTTSFSQMTFTMLCLSKHDVKNNAITTIGDPPTTIEEPLCKTIIHLTSPNLVNVGADWKSAIMLPKKSQYSSESNLMLPLWSMLIPVVTEQTTFYQSLNE